MSFRPIIQQFDRQPSPNSCEIDWDNPITSQLVGAWLPTGTGFVDMVDGQPPSSVSATGFDAGRLGVGVDFDPASNSQVVFPHRDRYATISPRGMTIVAAVRCDTATGVQAILAKQTSTTTYAPYEFRLNQASGSRNPYLVRAYATGYRGCRATSNIWTVGAEMWIAFTQEDDQVESLGTIAIDGDFYGTALFGGSGAGTVADNGASVYIGRRYDGASELNGTIFGLYLFNRSLLLDELKAITTRGWQVFV